MKLGRDVLLGAILLSNLFLNTNVNAFASSGPYCPDALFWRLSPPGDFIESIVETDSSQKLNLENLKLLVWNVYKGGKPGVYADLDILTQNSDLALLQEGHLSKAFLNLACSRQEMNWKMARNFIDDKGIFAGVLTAGRANPDDFFYLKSPNTEPFSDVHKMTLVNLYDIPETGEKLMVLNVHGINFVPQGFFENQINMVAETIKGHTGPILFAGDFNTYTTGRTEFLLKTMKSLGLKHAEVKGNEYSGLFVLDHLFYRGFKITKTEVLHDVTTSDHKPLYFELKLL
ncbi:MAG: endonuclease/exonuclease/phosphatase family protein [Bdellovibrionota bacterium]